MNRHPFLQALHRGFTEHRPICISPDMIWLLICQGVANHVNAHAERLRPRFVAHQGKVKILVQRDDFVKGARENPWGEVVDEFSAQVREQIGSTHGLFVPHFSTTGQTERIAAEIVLLGAVQRYFDFSLHDRMRNPGDYTRRDARGLAVARRPRAQAFATLDLEWWLNPLQPILEEFAATAGGDVHPAFWKSIFKFRSRERWRCDHGLDHRLLPVFAGPRASANGEESVAGRRGAERRRILAGEWDPKKKFDGGGIRYSDFTSGLAWAPLQWKYRGTEFPMLFLGGFVGIAQDPTTLALRPEIGWVIRHVTGSR